MELDMHGQVVKNTIKYIFAKYISRSLDGETCILVGEIKPRTCLYASEGVTKNGQNSKPGVTSPQ